MIRVAVVDDHPLFRDGVIQTLQSASDIDIVGQGASAEDAIRIAVECRPDVMTLDMNLANGSDGISAVERIVTEAASVRILVLTVVADADRMRDAIGKGSRGYVLKGIGGAELMNAVRAVHCGDGYVTPTLAARLFSKPDACTENASSTMRLSVREDQILSHIARGLSNKEIGLLLELSEKTVKHYVTNLFQKMQVRNRTEAAICASRQNGDRGGAALAGHAGQPMSQFPSLEYTRPI